MFPLPEYITMVLEGRNLVHLDWGKVSSDL